MKTAVRFSDAEANEDGLIRESDLFALLDGAIDAYDELLEYYAAEEENAA